MDHIVSEIASLEALYGDVNEVSALKEISFLHPHYAAFVRAAPFAVLATAGPHGLDASPRGDQPGFVEIVDETTLMLPDRRSNNRIDSLRNILSDPRVALLFVVPGIGETLRVNGTAQISADPELLARFAVNDKPPRTVLIVHIESVFFRMVPESVLLPVVLLATCATVIASQALISGVFSLTAQAVKLDYLPRIKILHTSHSQEGQIYVPLVNWLLMIACVGLVVGFRTSSNLAAAYGIAVTMTMAITTLIFFRVLTDRWEWRRAKAFLVCGPLFVIELGFLGANVVKIPHGEIGRAHV